MKFDITFSVKKKKKYLFIYNGKLIQEIFEFLFYKFCTKDKDNVTRVVVEFFPRLSYNRVCKIDVETSLELIAQVFKCFRFSALRSCQHS